MDNHEQSSQLSRIQVLNGAEQSCTIIYWIGILWCQNRLLFRFLNDRVIAIFETIHRDVLPRNTIIYRQN